MVKKNNKIYLIILFALYMGGCDFTPSIYKQIIKAQESIYQQEYDDAIKRYQYILESNTDNELKIKILFQLGELYSLTLYQNQKAITYFIKIKELTDDPIWLVKVEEKLGEINFSYLKDYANAIESYQKLTLFIPRLEKMDFYQIRLVKSLINDHEYKKGLTLLKKIQKNTNHEFYGDSFYHMGMIYFQQKKWNSAILSWNQYIKIEKKVDKVVQVKFLMANAYETLEELAIAYDLYYSILNVYPNTKIVKDRLESIYDRRVSRKR